MDLRTVQTALFAGRAAASRWTTSTTLNSTATFARHISSTRARLQEAEAVAPQPSYASGSTPTWSQHMQQQQQQPQQKAVSSPPSSSNPATPENGRKKPRAFGTTWSQPFALPENEQVKAKATAMSWAHPSAVSRTEKKTIDVIKSIGWMSPVNAGTAPNNADFVSSRERLQRPLPEDIKLRLRPVLGRVVKLGEQHDFASALKVLTTKVTINRVASDFQRQKFHERPGLKKKRLRSSRWRTRFRHGFVATCERVSELAKQGW